MQQVRASVRSAVMELMNAGEQVPVAVVTVPGPPAGSAASSSRAYSSVDEVLVDILRLGHERLTEKLEATGMVRRRSMSTAIELRLKVLWDDIETHPDEYRLAMLLHAVRPELMVPGPAGTLPYYELPLIRTEQWLATLGRLYNATWDEPLPLLARLLVTTLHGLIIDTVSRPIPEGTRRLLTIVAYEFAEHSTRDYRRSAEDV